jgi:photosystem I reaction center subunit XII
VKYNYVPLLVDETFFKSRSYTKMLSNAQIIVALILALVPAVLALRLGTELYK